MVKIADPPMKNGDVHCVFDPSQRSFACWKFTTFQHSSETVSRRQRLSSFVAHGEGANGPGYDRIGGDTVPGLYKLAKPRKTLDTESAQIHREYGPWFINLGDWQGAEEAQHRAGEGVHGGGSGCSDPSSPMQGWCPTMGCVRMQNQDLEVFVGNVISWQNSGATVWFTVLNWP